MKMLDRWKRAAHELTKESYVVYLAMRHRRTPWYAKLLAACVAGYAFSPIDLIPDFIPILGLLDDLLLVPFGVAAVLKLIPRDVVDECRERAHADARTKPRNLWAAAVIVVSWAALLLLGLALGRNLFAWYAH